MNHLWAPWRHSYITAEENPDECVLCTIGRESDRDADNFVLYRENGFYVVLNRYPYINGHLMIVPEKHVPDLRALGSDGQMAMMSLIAMCETALAEGLGCMGMNGGWNVGNCAGAGIPGHIHMHLLPRWSGDVNFMTTVGGTRVMSASLEDSYRSLLPYFRGEEDD